MATFTISYGDEEASRFKRVLFSEDAWEAIERINKIAKNQIKHGDPEHDRETIESIRSELEAVLWKGNP